MSKEILFDKYGNEIVKLEVKYNDKLQSICMNCSRIGGVKWNDIDNGSFLTLTLNKKDLIDQLVENEVKFDFNEDDDGETVKQVIVDDEKYIDIEYFAKIKAELETKLAEKDDEITQRLVIQERDCNQDKISFAVEQLEKVKEILLENLYDLYSKPSEIWDKYGDLYDVVVEGAVNGTIDNQIKQLKEMK